jgi:hypothetical protein
VKRYLERSEHRLKLDELFTREADRLLAHLQSGDFAATGPWDVAAFRDRVHKYEAAAEPLARMCGVLGRWGDNTHVPIVLDLIRVLCADAARIGGGLTVYIYLRLYPAVLVLTAFGLGATRAGHWDALYALFSGPVPREDRESRQAVQMLFLNAWEAGTKEVWQNATGLERRKTPLSDHLLDVFTHWAKSFMGLTPDFELTFERFEILGSLAHLERNDKASLKEELFAATSNNPNPLAWMPVGRVGWDTRRGEQLLIELKAKPIKTALLDAGFAKGDPEFFDLFVENFSRFAKGMRW